MPGNSNECMRRREEQPLTLCGNERSVFSARQTEDFSDMGDGVGPADRRRRLGATGMAVGRTREGRGHPDVTRLVVTDFAVMLCAMLCAIR